MTPTVPRLAATAAAFVLFVPAAAHAQSLAFTNDTTANGLASNNVLGLSVSGSTVCAATNGGLSVGVPVPAPSALALLCAAGAAGRRRRRRG